MTPTRETVLAALRCITDPRTGSDLISADIIRALTVENGRIRFVMEVDRGDGETMEAVRVETVTALEALVGPGNVIAVLTAENRTAPPPDPGVRKSSGEPRPLKGVKAIIAVASGKGGVGKSTVSANLAVALAALGRRTGMLDADVYGPSQPRMLGVSGRPASPDGRTILPLRNHGVTLMSIGLMTREDEAVVWRGPMLMGALQQMLRQVQWGQLDVLIVDLPPGTGDVQMTLAQQTSVAGAILVSTPQDIALLDARKAIDMFRKMKTPVLGMIENMSTHICRRCGHEEHVFGHGGARADAERLGLPFLGEIPLDIDIRLAADGGAPIVVSKPESPQARAFLGIARKLIDDDIV
ncbi:MAG: Mrp/NBP35 family ATP-binding protein [Geminicoccaceae bacterium]|nr:Mrp/NBP35 family ATP-binding protein [Geminicoccaceae bacterium]